MKEKKNQRYRKGVKEKYCFDPVFFDCEYDLYICMYIWEVYTCVFRPQNTIETTNKPIGYIQIKININKKYFFIF